MTSRKTVRPASRRGMSKLMWVGLAACCLAISGRGLTAQSTGRSRSEVRAVPNSGISTAAGKSTTERREPREPKLPRQDVPVTESDPAEEGASGFPAGFQPEKLVSPGGLSSTINLMVVLTVLSLAPSILIMTTCFIRFIIVTSLLRQALGTQQLPPNQVLITLCLFLTFMVMAPVWQMGYDEGIRPYTNPEPGQPQPTLAQTFENTARPIREFMRGQIERANNTDTVWLFLDYQHPGGDPAEGKSESQIVDWNDVPLPTLVSAYMLSELKTAFLIGFQIFLPFLVIDMVVSTVLMSMGMMMLPPTLVSFPFKLLLFVLIDGWALTVGMLLDSVRVAGTG